MRQAWVLSGMGGSDIPFTETVTALGSEVLCRWLLKASRVLAELNQGSWLLCRSHEAAQTPGKVEIRAAAPEPGLEGLGTGRAGLSLCRGKQQGSRRGGTRGLRSHS